MPLPRSFSPLPRSVRLVDVALRRLGGLSARDVRQRHRRLRINILEEQDGRSPVPRL